MKGFIIIRVYLLSLLLLISQISVAQETILTAPPAIEIEQVNVNRADAQTIALVLSGIGISRAEAIVEFREINGEFRSLNDLTMVSGVGEVTLLKNEGKITFD